MLPFIEPVGFKTEDRTVDFFVYVLKELEKLLP